MAESTSFQISGDFTLVENSSSSLNGVIFHNVQAIYTADEAINCVYSITDEIEPELGDVIGLFKVGWTSSSECYSSVPAKTPVNNDKQFLKSVFGAHLLPNDSSELYQFCYISKMRVVGASTPFTFESSDIIAVEDPTDPGLLVFKSRVSQLKDELHKLSDEKTYYASKYKILHSNFQKLKSEFDNIEQELKVERENSKRLEEANAILIKQLKEKDTVNQSVKEHVESENLGLKSSEINELDDDTKLLTEAMNSVVWKSLYEIYEVATEINQSFQPQEMRTASRMIYQDFINYVLEVFSAAKRKFQIKQSGIIDESKHCKCYFQQKSLCCPTLCSETAFEIMLTQPLYTCFSNSYHFSKNGGTHCDGSFDSSSLTDYIKTILEIQNKSLINSVDSEAIEDNNAHSSEIINAVSEGENESKFHETNKERNNSSSNMPSDIDEEREKVNNELKLSREKIASLNSRVNVLELELVAQQSCHLKKNESLSEDNCQVLVPSSPSVNTLDIESVLECVHNEYMNLKDKYRELSKNIAKMYSLEAKCTALEEENAKLIQYFTGDQEHNKKYSNSTDQFCSDLGNLMAQKNKVENKLISLQKESVGDRKSVV